MVTQVIGFLPTTKETWIAFPAPGLALGQPWPCGHLGGESADGSLLSMSIPVFLILKMNKERKKKNIF